MCHPENTTITFCLDENGVFLNYYLILILWGVFECAFFTLQLASKEIATKKEQISEALQATQLFLAKHGDKYVGSHCPFHSVEGHVLKSIQQTKGSAS